MTEIAKTLQEAREKKGYSFWKAGQLSGLTITQIKRLESGGNLTIELLNKYANIYGMEAKIGRVM